MIELLYNTIRVTAGDDTPIEAIIKDSTGAAITTGNIFFVIPDANIKIQGTYETNKWVFVVPKSELKGRHMYHFELNGTYLDFATPIYFE